MQAYKDSFARIYNLRWGEWAKSIAPYLEKFLASFSNVSEQPTLLDLCCGTGQLALHFLQRGFRVIGVDLSAAMLQYARENCKEYLEAGLAQFIHADATDFTLEEPVQFAVSTYDALNHLADLEALKKCLKCVHRALMDEGVFIFDLNTRLGLRRWATLRIEDEPNLTLMQSGLLDEAGRKAWVRIWGFLRADDGRYDRFEETVFNTAFHLTEVSNALKETGWHRWHFSRLGDLNTPLEDPEQEGRVFVVAYRD